jgi:hypothetical protein
MAETATSQGDSGSDVQSRRQKEIERLANLLIEADNDEDAAAANDQLGVFVFGK